MFTICIYAPVLFKGFQLLPINNNSGVSLMIITKPAISIAIYNNNYDLFVLILL